MRRIRTSSVLKKIAPLVALSFSSLFLWACTGVAQSAAPPPAALAVSTSGLPLAIIGSLYSVTLGASGGTAPYQWSITAGALPGGLTLNAGTGAITGTPGSAGTSNFTIQVQDSKQQVASANLGITVAAPLTITTTTLTSGTVGVAYAAMVSASGGTAPYQWSITAGALPVGLTLSGTTGGISGTPTSATTSPITVEVMDSSVPTQTFSKSFSLVVSPASPPPGAVVVTNFGATGNGSTDDTNAINAAIASLQTGGTLYFPCGTYLVSAALRQLSLSNVQVLGPPSQCVTIHANSANSFNVLTISGGLSSSVNLAADVTTNTFTLVSGGVATLGLSVGDDVIISDTAVNDNGAGSPPIATREVVQVAGISGDAVTINGTFAWMFTLVSPHPEQWGGNPFAQKLNPVSNVIVKYISFDGTGSTGTINPLRFNNAVNSEVGFVNISNFVSNAAAVDGFSSNTGYQNNFHDMVLTNAANGPLPSGEGEAMFSENQSYLTVNNISITASAGQGVFGFGCHDCTWGTISNVTIDLGGATGRVFKTLRADHNTFNNIVAKNGVGHNGINITDVSQYNVFNNCQSTGNDQHGIDMFGSYDVGNTFNNCTSEFNAGRQFNFSSGFSGQYADDSTTINGGTFCCARGGGAIIQQNGTGFTLSGATVSDDQHGASSGLSIDGMNCTVTNNTFSGFPAGHDIAVTSDVGCSFSGNSTPDGTTPSGLASLFEKAERFYAWMRSRGPDINGL
jgi:hypothetical protein